MTKTTIRIRVISQGDQYLGECLEFPVMTHGKTLEDLAENMEKAIGLFLSEEQTEPDQEEAVLAVQVQLPKVATSTEGV